MPKINILVEGPTEETFVRNVLDPYFLKQFNGTSLNAILLGTRIDVAGKKWRGGVSNYSKFRADALKLLRDAGAVALTSIVDLYGLPKDFPGYRESLGLTYRKRVSLLEQRLKEDIADKRFVPYLSTHEFEALLLTDPTLVAKTVGARAAQTAALVSSLRDYDSPEAVNFSAHPSKRLTEAFPQYDKVRHGPISASAIGLERIRSSCEHFHEWLELLEPLCT